MIKLLQATVYLYLLLQFTSCTTDTPAPPPTTDYYLVTGNTLGLREGTLEVGQVVTLSDSSLTIYEPGRPDWSRSYRFRGDSLDLGGPGRWGMAGDSLLIGPEGNDYRLRKLTPGKMPRLDSLFAAGLRLTRATFFDNSKEYIYIAPSDSAGASCAVEYLPGLNRDPLPTNLDQLPENARKYLLNYRALDPKYRQFRYTTQFGKPLLVSSGLKDRVIYEPVQLTEDSLTVRAYNNLSPSRAGDHTSVWALVDELEVAPILTENMVWLAAEDTRLDSIGWARRFGESDYKKYAAAPLEFEVPDLQLAYNTGSLALTVNGRQLWRRPVKQVAHNLIVSPGDNCFDQLVLPIDYNEQGRPLLLVPLRLRKGEREQTTINGETFETFASQFRWQPFELVTDEPELGQ